MRKIILLFPILFFAKTYSFAQSKDTPNATGDISSIVQFLSNVKDKNEFILNQILQIENIEIGSICTADSCLEKLTNKKLEILSRDRYIYEQYSNLKVTVDGLIVGLETDLLVNNKSLKKFKINNFYQTQINQIINYDKLLSKEYDRRYSDTISLASGTSLLPATILPAPLDLINAFQTILSSSRDFKVQQIQSLNSILDSFKITSIQDLQNGNTSSSSSSSSSSGSSSKKGGSGKPKN